MVEYDKAPPHSCWGLMNGRHSCGCLLHYSLFSFASIGLQSSCGSSLFIAIKNTFWFLISGRGSESGVFSRLGLRSVSQDVGYELESPFPAPFISFFILRPLWYGIFPSLPCSSTVPAPHLPQLFLFCLPGCVTGPIQAPGLTYYSPGRQTDDFIAYAGVRMDGFSRDSRRTAAERSLCRE